MKLNPYLTFNGTCEEALTFYKACLGGEFESVNRFAEMPAAEGAPPLPEAFKNKIMHMTWRFDDNVVMASDSQQSVPEGGNIALSVNLDDAERLESVFDALSKDGTVTMPLTDTFWGARFGTLTDRYGIHWMFNCSLST